MSKPQPPLITPCADCGRQTVQRKAYRRSAALRNKYVRRASHGMCQGCYNSAWQHGTLPLPAPRRRPCARTSPDIERLRALVGAARRDSPHAEQRKDS